jgi:hypothetical protein
MLTLRSAVPAILAMVLFAPLPAAAAPQALAIVAPTAPAAFACGEEGCVLHLPALCLQALRDPPDRGTRYDIAAGAAALVVESRTGAILHLPAEGLVSFTANDTFNSISVRIAPDAATGLNARRIALAVEPGTILLPVEQAGDPNPQQPSEIALATGPGRAAVVRLLAAGSPRTEAAQLMSRAITLLPEEADAARPDARTLWSGLLAAAGVSGIDPAAVDLARQTTAVCPESLMRRCLELRQRDMLRPVNDRLWEEFGES